MKTMPIQTLSKTSLQNQCSNTQFVSVLSNFTPSAEWLKATQSMTG